MSNCLLLDPEAVMILPRDKGEPPSWGPRFAYLNAMVVWLDREEFNELQKHKNTRPCDICPSKVKQECMNSTPYFSTFLYESRQLLEKAKDTYNPNFSQTTGLLIQAIDKILQYLEVQKKLKELEPHKTKA